MRTRFAPDIPAPWDDPDYRNPDSWGVHLNLDGLDITGMTPIPEEWGVIWFNTLDGWWNSPSTTGETTQRTFSSGGWNSRAYRAPRVLEISGMLFGGDRPSVRRGVEALMAAIPLDESRPLVVREDGLKRYCMVRQLGDISVEWPQGGHIHVEWNVQLVASDPRIFGGAGPDDPESWKVFGPVGLPSSTGGLALPTFVPFTIDGQTDEGSVVVDVGGSAPPKVRIEIAGPSIQPGVRNNRTGQTIFFEDPSTALPELVAGDVLSIDFDTRTVTKNGEYRRDWMNGVWFDIQAGDELAFVGPASGNQSAQMTVYAQEAWL